MKMQHISETTNEYTVKEENTYPPEGITFQITTAQYNHWQSLDMVGRDAFQEILMEAAGIRPWGANEKSFAAAMADFAPTNKRVHGYGGGYWEQDTVVSAAGRERGFHGLHNGGFVFDPDGKVSFYLSCDEAARVRMDSDAVSKAFEDGFLCHRWVVRCYC